MIQIYSRMKKGIRKGSSVMQLIDIKNDLAKVVYAPAVQELFLADFLIVGDSNQNLLAQIIHIESTQKENENIALIKFILSVDKDGVVSPYNGYVPAKDATVNYMDSEEVVELLKASDETMPWGTHAIHKDVFVSLDLNFLKNKPYIQCDNLENVSTIINNVVAGIQKYNKKIVIIDFDGLYDDVHTTKLTITKDFKLPLDYDSFDYIYEHDLEGLDIQSRAAIQDILLDLQQYVKTTKEGFLPFNSFKSVVDAEYKKSPNSGIILLRNKLIKYAQQGLFAQSQQEFAFFDEWCDKENLLLIDASSVQLTWQKNVLSFILSQINQECFVILNLTETNSDKKIITKLYNSNKKVYPIAISSYKYEEAQLLKAIAKNLVLFTPIEKLNDFAGYNSFLSKLNYDEFIVWGEDTLHIPVILKLSLIDNRHLSNKTQEEIAKSVDDIFRSESKISMPTEKNISNESIIIEDQNDDTIDFNDTDDSMIVEDIEDFAEKTIENEPAVEPEIVAPSVSQNPTSQADLADIDYNSVFSEDDLDFIDNLNNDTVTDDFVTEIQDNAEPELPKTAVPIYPAHSKDDTVNSDTDEKLTQFKEGSFVYHPKYGKGIVEKIINYGSKNFCSIQFDTNGRRLLDLSLAELQLV